MAEDFTNYDAMLERVQGIMDRWERSNGTVDTFASATDMMAALRARRVSSAEVLQSQIDRIDEYNSRLNAIVSPDFERARAAAQAADQRRMAGEDRPLLGLPITIKDCIDVAGLPTTGGLLERREAVAAADALVTSRLRGAGAIVMAKTNVPPYADDWQSNNPVFGRSLNPWDETKTPGGSTGGGAAAVAAGLTPLEIGGDFCGSIRVPAAFCGVYGHKPSHSAVPATGHFPGGPLPNPTTGLAVNGPLARAAVDLDLTLDVIAWPQTGEDVAWQVSFPPTRHNRLRDFRVAIFPIPDWVPVEGDIVEALQAVTERLRSLGITVGEETPIPDVQEFYALYLRMMAVISSTRTPRDERRQQAEIDHESGDALSMARSQGLLMDAQDYVALHERREEYRAMLRSFFRNWDVLLSPVNVVSAFHHTDEPRDTRTLSINGQNVPYDLQSFFPGLCNFSGHPGTAFPVGLTAAGLPIGLQAVGPYLEDRTPIRFAQCLAEEYGGFTPPPGFS